MNVKKFLNQAYLINVDITSRLEQLEELKALAQRITVAVGDVKVQSTKEKSPMENAVIKIVQAEESLNKAVNDLIETKETIRKIILKINNNEYRALLELRYLCFNSWERIAIKLNSNCNSIYQQHYRALKSFEKLYAKEADKYGKARV